jgi:hypothetical protein
LRFRFAGIRAHVARAETASLAFRSRGAKRVGDDRAQCPRTAAAIRATAEALIDLGGCARKPRPRVEAGTYIILGENVTGADDHRFSAEVSRRLTSLLLRPRMATDLRRGERKSLTRGKSATA